MNKLVWQRIRDELSRLKGKVPTRNSDGEHINYRDRAKGYYYIAGIGGVREYVDRVLELCRA